MYYFNEGLFSKLPDILGMTKKDFSEASFGAKHKYNRRLLDVSTLLFPELISLCNRFCLSLANFIVSTNNTPTFLDKEKYVIPKDKFLPIEFSPESIGLIYGKEGKVPGLTRYKLAQALGVSDNTVTNWKKHTGSSSISVLYMIKLCNSFGINISEFVSDPNAPLPQASPIETPIAITPKAWQELAELKQIASTQLAKIEELAAENAKLKLALRSGLYAAEPDGKCKLEMQKKREWIVNWLLLEKLHAVVGTSRNEMMRACGMKNTTVSFNGGDITVNMLVKLCNRWHISTRHFFLRDNGVKPSVYTYDYYQSKEWFPIAFHPEYLSDLFGKESLTGLSWDEVIHTECLSEWKIRSWRKPDSPMRITDLVRICNELDVTPSCFITDRNCMELAYPMTHTEFLMEENHALRQKIIRLTKRMSKYAGNKGQE